MKPKNLNETMIKKPTTLFPPGVEEVINATMRLFVEQSAGWNTDRQDMFLLALRQQTTKEYREATRAAPQMLVAVPSAPRATLAEVLNMGKKPAIVAAIAPTHIRPVQQVLFTPTPSGNGKVYVTIRKNPNGTGGPTGVRRVFKMEKTLGGKHVWVGIGEDGSNGWTLKLDESAPQFLTFRIGSPTGMPTTLLGAYEYFRTFA